MKKNIKLASIIVILTAIVTVSILTSFGIQKNIVCGAILINILIALSSKKLITLSLKNSMFTKFSINVLLCITIIMLAIGIMCFVLWRSIVLDIDQYLKMVLVADNYLISSILFIFVAILVDLFALLETIIQHLKEEIKIKKNGQ